MPYIFKMMFSFLKKEFKLIGLYFGLYIVLLLIFSKNQSSNFIILKDYLVNYKFKEFTPIGIMNYILEISFILYLYIKLFSESLKFGIEYLLTRFSSLKFILYNIAFSGFFLIIFIFVKYAIYWFIFYNSVARVEIFEFAIKELLFLVNVVLTTNLIIILHSKYFILSLSVILCMLFYWNCSVISYNIYLYMFSVVILILLIIFSIRRAKIEELESFFKCR